MLVLGRIILAFLGFVTACLAASATIHTLLLATTTPLDGDVMQAVALVTVPIAAVAIGAFAFLPALVAVFIAEAWSLRGWLYHAIAGGLIGAACAAAYRNSAIDQALDMGADLQIFPPGMALEHSGLLPVSLAGGIVAGLAYWLVAGRSSGSWRAPTSPAP